jgi:hypothetical protein
MRPGRRRLGFAIAALLAATEAPANEPFRFDVGGVACGPVESLQVDSSRKEATLVVTAELPSDCSAWITKSMAGQASPRDVTFTRSDPAFRLLLKRALVASGVELEDGPE